MSPVGLPLKIQDTGLYCGVTTVGEFVGDHIETEIYEWKNELIVNYAVCT